PTVSSRPGLHTLSLHDALPIWGEVVDLTAGVAQPGDPYERVAQAQPRPLGQREQVDAVGEDVLAHRPRDDVVPGLPRLPEPVGLDRKSTRLNSSHVSSSYAVFC